MSAPRREESVPLVGQPRHRPAAERARRAEAERFTPEWIYRQLTARMPAGVAARMDLIRPSYRASWGGPMNGQRERRRLVRDLFGAIEIDFVVETGTYRGTTTEFLAHLTGSPIYTAERHPRYHRYARHRLAPYPDVTVVHGDSRDLLRRLASEPGAARHVGFFYLDAHWEADLPLREEIEIIAATWPRAVIVVDDFQVPGDPGYVFYTWPPYGPLSAACLPVLDGWEVRYPAAPAVAETGARAGCVVLVAPALAAAISGLPSLRSAADRPSDIASVR